MMIFKLFHTKYYLVNDKMEYFKATFDIYAVNGMMDFTTFCSFCFDMGLFFPSQIMKVIDLNYKDTINMNNELLNEYLCKKVRILSSKKFFKTMFDNVNFEKSEKQVKEKKFIYYLIINFQNSETKLRDSIKS